MRGPLRHHFGEHLGFILAPFWHPFGSQNRSQSGFEGVENLVEKVEGTKTRKKWPKGRGGPLTVLSLGARGRWGGVGEGGNILKRETCWKSNTPFGQGPGEFFN